MIVKNFFVVFIFAILFLFISCSSTGFLMAKPKVVMYGATYPSKTENENIDVYSMSKPKKDFIEIAEISCGDTEDDWNMKQILLKAREIGADGIINTGRAGAYGVGVPVGYSTYLVSEDYGIKAIAIKYKDN